MAHKQRDDCPAVPARSQDDLFYVFQEYIETSQIFFLPLAGNTLRQDITGAQKPVKTAIFRPPQQAIFQLLGIGIPDRLFYSPAQHLFLLPGFLFFFYLMKNPGDCIA